MISTDGGASVTYEQWIIPGSDQNTVTENIDTAEYIGLAGFPRVVAAMTKVGFTKYYQPNNLLFEYTIVYNRY